MAGLYLLSEYLGSFRHKRWRPGVLDCGVFMADWVRLVCGVDPIADVRGTYASARGFERIVRREGGMRRACAQRLGSVGMRETLKPAAGDVACVLAPCAGGRFRPTGAICTGSVMRAVITSDSGLVICPIHTLIAWTFDA